MNNFDEYWESMARKIGDAFSEGHLEDAELLFAELKREVRGKFGALRDASRAEVYEGEVEYYEHTASDGDYYETLDVAGDNVKEIFDAYTGSKVRVTIERLKEGD